MPADKRVLGRSAVQRTEMGEGLVCPLARLSYDLSRSWGAFSCAPAEQKRNLFFFLLQCNQDVMHKCPRGSRKARTACWDLVVAEVGVRRWGSKRKEKELGIGKFSEKATWGDV